MHLRTLHTLPQKDHCELGTEQSVVKPGSMEIMFWTVMYQCEYVLTYYGFMHTRT